MSDQYTINVWVNAERGRRLDPGVAQLVDDVLAGLRVIRVPVTSEHRDRLLLHYPQAKCDTSTTGTIELLPREVKDALFALVLERRTADVLGAFLDSLADAAAG